MSKLVNSIFNKTNHKFKFYFFNNWFWGS